MQYIRRNGKLLLWALAIVGLGGIGPAHAQNSVAGWPDENFLVRKSQAVQFNTRATVLKSGKFESDEEEQKFADFYNLSLFPNVTNPENRQLLKDDASARREDVITKLRYDLRACEKVPEQQVFNKLADLTLAYMTEIAADSRFHPAARVNAMLAIGEVNSPKAAKVLLDTALSRRQLFAVRVAAMTGLVRMAGPSGRGALSDPEIEPLILKNMVAFVKFHPPKGDRIDGIYWMRGQAADVLAELGNGGSQNEVPPALLTMLNDKDLPIPLRSKAARALGKLNYGGNPPAAGPYLTALRDFGREALSSEQPADRGRVRLVARDVSDGLRPLASRDQPLLDGLKKTFQTLNKETEEKMTSEDLKTAIAKAKASLDGLVKNEE
jgi:hypothetical protein